MAAFSFFGKKAAEQPSEQLWKNLISLEELETIFQKSLETPQLIFKHSTRCGISRVVLRRFESDWNLEVEGTLHFLDLIQYRDVSNAIADRTGIIHQSPQVLLLDKGKVVADDSHQSISAEQYYPLMS